MKISKIVLALTLIYTLCGFSSSSQFDSEGYIQNITIEERQLVDRVLDAHSEELAELLQSGGKGGVSFITPDGKVLYGKAIN